MTLVTTLLAPESYPVTALAEWYRPRRHIATSLAHLKTTMQLDGRHGKTVPGVLNELPVFTLVDNLGRTGMGHSARLQHLNVERISFLEALRWLGAPHPGMSRMAWMVTPKRPPRVEPRGTKRRPQRVPLMMQPRHLRRQQRGQQPFSSYLHAIRV